jgi:RNA polymerase subunit RPABC4/transcription elongation factor Spt4
MYCPNCGKEAKEESRFCPECGVSLKQEEVARKSIEDKKPQAPSVTIPLTPGKIITSLGAILVIVCFFLPWVHGCSGYELGTEAVKGGSDPSIELLLLSAIPVLGAISLVLIWASRQGLGLSLLSAIGGVISLLVLHSKSDVPIEEYQEGVWGTVVGFILIVIGSVVELSSADEESKIKTLFGSIDREPKRESVSETVQAEESNQKERACGQCGTEIDEGDEFCPECGQKLGKEA